MFIPFAKDVQTPGNASQKNCLYTMNKKINMANHIKKYTQYFAVDFCSILKSLRKNKTQTNMSHYFFKKEPRYKF